MKAQKLQKLDWSDVPYILSVCEAGSLAAAARMMGVNHSTVFRRVESVEAKLGVRLFDRQARGYVMTAAGELFFQRAGLLCESMNRIELELAGKDLRLEGKLTVTTTDSLLHCLSPVFRAFQEKHPDVELRLLSDARPFDLMQRDADIALRPTQRPPEHWVGRRLVPIVCAIYAHEDYWKAAKHLPPEQQRWVVLDDDLNQSPMSQIAKSRMADDAPMTVVNTVMGVFDMVRSGLGIAALPCYLGAQSSGFVQIHEPDNRIGWDLWLLAHPDVRRSARVHAFFDYASSAITEEVLNVPLVSAE
ncbi:MAG: LysR family transcriptional regulator [Pseudomonadota bacterium]